MPNRFNRGLRKRNTQSGFAIVSLTIALAITSVLAVFAANRLRADLDRASGVAAGSYALAVKNALDEFITTNSAALSSNTPIPGYSNTLAPTISELKTAGHLPATFPAIDPFRLRYLSEVTRTNCPGATCSITAKAYTHRPLMQRCTAYAADGACNASEGLPKYNTLEVIRQNSAGFGAIVTAQQPTRFRGTSCDYPLPTGAAAGTYGVCATQGGAIYSQFVRIADERDPVLRGTFTVDGLVTAKGGAQIEGNTSALGNITSTGIVQSTSWVASATYSVGASCTNDMALSKASSNELIVCSGGAWRSMLKIQNEGDSCATNGATALTASGASTSQQGQTLVCMNNRFVSFARILRVETPGAACSIAGAVGFDGSASSIANINSMMICRANPLDSTNTKVWYRLHDLVSNIQYVAAYNVTQGTVINRPTCQVPSGMSATSITQIMPNIQTTNDGGMVVRAEETSTRWTVRFYSGDGSLQGGNPSAIAQVYCFYY